MTRTIAEIVTNMHRPTMTRTIAEIVTNDMCIG